MGQLLEPCKNIFHSRIANFEIIESYDPYLTGYMDRENREIYYPYFDDR
jgi:hypothetical protein